MTDDDMDHDFDGFDGDEATATAITPERRSNVKRENGRPIGRPF